MPGQWHSSGPEPRAGVQAWCAGHPRRRPAQGRVSDVKGDLEAIAQDDALAQGVSILVVQRESPHRRVALCGVSEPTQGCIRGCLST